MDAYGYPKIVGFIDDSLVIVADERSWRQRFSDGTDIVGLGRQRLRLFNYRVQEEGPRWMDTLDNYNDECDYILGQLSDSVIWGGESALYTKVWDGPVMSFWKIGEKPRKMKIKKVLDGCNVYFRVERLRNWLDGMIYAGENLMASGDTCQYAILDTVARTLTYKRLDKDLKWIENCNDVRVWGDDVICSVPGEHSLEGCVLNNNIDTLSVPLVFNKGLFWGNMVELRASICRLETKKISCLDTAFTWSEPLKFYRNGEIVVDLE